jgi:hypothetical protein
VVGYEGIELSLGVPRFDTRWHGPF